MKLMIVVLVVVAIAFGVVAIQGGSRDSHQSDPCAPPPIGADGDTSAVSDWRPCSGTKFLGKLSTPFAPRVKWTDSSPINLPPGEHAVRDIPEASSWFSARNTRIAQVHIGGTGGMAISYACQHEDCRKNVCICSPGATFTSTQIDLCPDDNWRKKRRDGIACRDEDTTTNIVIYPQHGQLTFTAIGMSAVTADLR